MFNLDDLVTDKVDLEYWNGDRWIPVGEYKNENIAWMTLGDDNFNYRTVSCSNGIVIRANI